MNLRHALVYGFIILCLLITGKESATAQTARDLKACQNAASDPDRAIPACTVFIRTRRAVNGQHLPDAALSGLYFLRGFAHLIREDLRPAISDFTGALPSSSSQASLLMFRARAYLKLKEFSAAMADLNRAVEDARRTGAKAIIKAEILNSRAVAYLMQHDFERSLSDANEAIAVNPKFGFAYFTRAMLEQYQGNDEKADADYDLAMKLDPKDAKTFAGYKEFEASWRDYLKDIEETKDYANWSGPPLQVYRGVGLDEKLIDLPKRDSGKGPEAGSCSLAVIHWQSAEAIGTLAAYEDHLARFPNCPFAGLARARVESLKKAETARTGGRGN